MTSDTGYEWNNSISLSEMKYIQSGIEQNIRNDGRHRLQYRNDFSIEVGVISQAAGSARLRLANTEILVGIKVEIGTPKESAPNEGYFEYHIECCPSASTEFEGRGAEQLNLELARSLKRLYANKTCFDLEKLSIIEGEQCWVIFIDALILQVDGNIFDCVSIACRAALYDCRVPNIQVIKDGDATELQISDDPLDAMQVDTSRIPVAVTLTKIASRFVVDATIEEEFCQSARLTIGINKQGNSVSVQKAGKGGLLPSSVSQMMMAARKIGCEIITRLDTMLERTTQQKKNHSSTSIN